MKFIYLVVCFVFFLGVVGVLLKRYHLLTMMLCLELLLVSLFIKFSIFVGVYKKFSFSRFSLILLTFSACEVSVGLSFLVLISRFFGKKKVFSLNLLRL